MTKEVSQTLREELLSLSFHAYEECVRQLLVALGYTDVKLMGRRVGRRKTTHGGLDVQAYTEVGVTRLSLVAQVKQYTQPVPRRFVDELRGAMLRAGAGQGILITTSTFSQAAKRAVASDRTAPIRLIEGEELVSLLIQNGIGAMTDSENGITVDISAFEQLRERFPGQTRQRRTHRAKEPPTPVSRPSAILSHIHSHHETAMLSRTHILIGVSTLWGLAVIPDALTRDNVALLAGVATFGALLPDLDAVESKIKSLSIKGVRPFAPFADMANQVWGHRGFLHSPLALGLLGVALMPSLYWVDWQVPLALWLGYGSHLMADACTRTGIPGSPFTKRIFLLPKRWRILTGSAAEELLFPFLATSAMFFFLHFLYTR